jgi:hypothetical protein
LGIDDGPIVVNDVEKVAGHLKDNDPPGLFRQSELERQQRKDAETMAVAVSIALNGRNRPATRAFFWRSARWHPSSPRCDPPKLSAPPSRGFHVADLRMIIKSSVDLARLRDPGGKRHEVGERNPIGKELLPARRLLTEAARGSCDGGKCRLDTLQTRKGQVGHMAPAPGLNH